jgi:type IV pilus assembly protein PilM
MISFLSLKQNAFGLDISDSFLRVACLEKKGRFFKLVSWGKIEVEKGVIEEGEIKDENTLAQIIKKGITKLSGRQLNTKNVIACLPENKAFFQIIRTSKTELSEIKKAILFEAENYIPLPLENSYLDFEVNGASGVLTVALSKNVVDPYVSTLKKAGLTPLALEVESQSVSRALIKNNFSKEAILIIDFKEGSASFIIFFGSSLCFTSSVLLPSEKELSSEVKKCIDYYDSHNEQAIKRIILCGTKIISSPVKISSEIGNPWINILPESFKEVPPISRYESVEYTTALGLALRGASEEL